MKPGTENIGRSLRPTTVCNVLVAVALMTCSTSSTVNAQHEPNRQLVQAEAPKPPIARRVALVIGNGAYTTAPALRNPPNDARDMAATLASLGFEVSRGVNVNQREMKRLIREFGQKLKAGGHGLFYYAGHGVQARGRNFIIPVDAEIQSEADVEDSGVDVGLVLNYMDDAQNGLNIVILDACRNNPFARSFRSASDGLAQVDAPTGTLIAYATAPGRVAADGVGENGLYTSELLTAMRLPGLTATDMFMRVRAEVMKKTGNKQVPWEASSLVGSFYFSGGANLSASNSGANNTALAENKFDAAAFEYSYWETIRNSNSADDFKAYLEKYPSGQFVTLAKNRIKSLEIAAKPAELPPTSSNSAAAEIAFWDSIKNSSSAGDFKAYLEKYPNGEFAALARRRLVPLETAEREIEIARPIKTFKIDWGYRATGGDLLFSGHLLIWAQKYEIELDQTSLLNEGARFHKKPEEVQKWANHWRQTSQRVDCPSFKVARVDDFWIREIKSENMSYRLRFQSPTDAADALVEIQRICKAILKREF